MVDPPDLERATLRPFVDAEKACPDPPSATEARVFARLTASLGLPPLAAKVTPPAPGPGVAPRGLGGRLLARFSARAIATFFVSAAALAATYGTIVRLRHEQDRRAASPAALPSQKPGPAPAAAPGAPGPAPPPVTEPDHSREPEPPASDGRDRNLAAERRLVETARSALARGQTDRALAALHQHARTYPRGRLAEERDSLLVQALVAKGQLARARQRAQRFERQYPRSLFQPVIDDSLRSIR